MTTMIAIRDMLALEGRLQATQISQRTGSPLPLVEAMLLRLKEMGKAECVTQEPGECFTGSCRSCPQGKRCLPQWWTLRQ